MPWLELTKSQPMQRKLNILLCNYGWWQNELRELGHNVFTVSWLAPGSKLNIPRLFSFKEILSELPADFKPDCLVYFDDSYPLSIVGLEEVDIPKLFYSVDVQHHHQWHKHVGGMFDEVWVAQKDFLPQMQLLSDPELPLKWQALWADGEIGLGLERDIDVCFRGNLDAELHPERGRFFQEIAEDIPIDAREGEYRLDYQRAKIVLNECVAGDLNFRVFEAMAAGALLLTPRIANGIQELFTENEQLVFYDDAKDAKRLIKHYLAHPEQRERIARAGQAEVRARHMARNRAEDLAETCERLLSRKKPVLNLCAARTYLQGVGAYKKDIPLDLPERTKLLNLAKESLLRSAKLREPGPIEDLWATVLTAKCYLEQLELQVELRRFTEGLLSEEQPDEMLLLIHLDSLEQTGARVEAEELKAKLPEASRETIEEARLVLREAVAGMKQRLFS